ncbi:hypothetical protein, conserved [Plasmodium gonderi]|uniref:Ribosome biogenesis protein BOP1 homolog n=1 Tax=Plasmodium gonderi TaxID=77519 RepID=A0A1Y1JKV9_PLAGO|nr:hypothetical protein, conserved [Plasmodium gonderi]GAW83156.1 hypothetical protein, conserved [Plasmodium gonderi]
MNQEKDNITSSTCTESHNDEGVNQQSETIRNPNSSTCRSPNSSCNIKIDNKHEGLCEDDRKGGDMEKNAEKEDTEIGNDVTKSEEFIEEEIEETLQGSRSTSGNEDNAKRRIEKWAKEKKKKETKKKEKEADFGEEEEEEKKKKKKKKKKRERKKIEKEKEEREKEKVTMKRKKKKKLQMKEHDNENVRAQISQGKKKKKQQRKLEKKKMRQQGSEMSELQAAVTRRSNKGDLKKDVEVLKFNGIKRRGEKMTRKETEYEDSTGSEINGSNITSVNTKRGSNIFANEEIEESDDEYNLNTLGNFDLKYYDDLDIIGYDIMGNKIHKKDENTIDDFIESQTDKNAWRKIKDKKNNRIIELTDQDLEIIRSIRENRVATRLKETNYVYENEKDEYKLGTKETPNLKYKQSKEEKKRIQKIMNYLINKEKYPEKYKNEEDKSKLLYDLWNNKIFDEFNNVNEINLPNILPGHKYSYNPPPELMYSEAEKKKIMKHNNNTFIPHNFEKIRNIEFYKKTYFELYQRCLDIYLCSRSLKNVLHIKKEDLLPKLPSTKSLRPYPEHPIVKYIMNDDLSSHNSDKNKYLSQIDISEDNHIVYTIQYNKLYIFDILTSYNIATIDLVHYYNAAIPKKKNLEHFFDNIRIKVNKAYDIVAVSCANIIFLFHYESFVPPIKSSSTDNIEEIYRKDSKRSKNSFEENYKKEDKKDNKSHESLSEEPDSDEGMEDLSDDEDFDGIQENEFSEDDESIDEDSDHENHKDELGKNEKDTEEMLSRKKGEFLSRNMVYYKTKGLIGAFHKNFKNSDEYVYAQGVEVKWKHIKSNDRKIKYCVAIQHEGKIKYFSWNKNGNYLSVTCLRKVGQYHYCYLHHLKSMKSIKLIKKYKQKRGDIVQSLFFPSSPYFMVAYQNSITIYNLKAKSKKGRIVKKLRGVQNITCVDVHINESYILVSDEKGNVFIFDLDLSCNPYKKFHLQSCSMKKVEFHKKYNLFYTLSSNGAVNLFYSKFFQDYVTNPVLLPIKQLSNGSKISDVTWSGKNPWLFAHTEGNFSVLYT